MLRPEEASQNGVEGCMAVEDITIWVHQYRSGDVIAFTHSYNSPHLSCWAGQGMRAEELDTNTSPVGHWRRENIQCNLTSLWSLENNYYFLYHSTFPRKKGITTEVQPVISRWGKFSHEGWWILCSLPSLQIPCIWFFYPLHRLHSSSLSSSSNITVFFPPPSMKFLHLAILFQGLEDSLPDNVTVASDSLQSWRLHLFIFFFF